MHKCPISGVWHCVQVAGAGRRVINEVTADIAQDRLRTNTSRRCPCTARKVISDRVCRLVSSYDQANRLRRLFFRFT